ncbi:hypothetical protein [Massilia genomosp. 1]|uniref:hypothetical protein n=1 Tax=Massilia genomosp. 1 TaxID=2609280 RepID=UPI00280466F0|nr:hypothetical protein [Massilia genomosp. 1]
MKRDEPSAASPAPSGEVLAAAKSAGLRYVSDNSPGITRKAHGKHFIYLDAGSEKVSDDATLARIRALAIGSASWPAATCKRPGATPGSASNTATTRSGASCATKSSMSA